MTGLGIDVRDLVAGLIAVLLLLVAASLATTLHVHRRRRQRARQAVESLGRTIVAELPVGDDLVLLSEDRDRFYYGDRPIEKVGITAVRVLINGTPIAAVMSTRHAPDERQPTSFVDRPEGIARDRWDVAIESETDVVLVECGAVRERISQELARKVFDAVKGDLEARNAV
jgi:hypothetical protein